MQKIDFSQVIYDDVLEKYVNDGILKPLYLINPEFGGSSDEDNIVYVPESVVEHKEKIDEMIKEHIDNNKKVKYYCNAKYTGSSLIPSALIFEYSIDDKEKYKEEIEIWSNKKPVKKVSVSNTITHKDFYLPLGILGLIIGFFYISTSKIGSLVLIYGIILIIISLVSLFAGIHHLIVKHRKL